MDVFRALQLIHNKGAYMTSFSYHSGRAQTKRCLKGVYFADYSGFFGPQAWPHIGRQVERERAGGAVGVDRVYRASHDCTDALESVDFSYLIGTAPSFWIVNPAQQAVALRITRRLADIGVTRTVFLQDFEQLALAMAESQCLVSY